MTARATALATVALVLLASASPAGTDDGDLFTEDLDAAFEEARVHDRPLLVYVLDSL